MSPKRIFELLATIVGRLVAQIICMVVTWSIIGLMVRSYFWLFEKTPMKLDPIHFFLIVAISVCALVAWRMIDSADLEG